MSNQDQDATEQLPQAQQFWSFYQTGFYPVFYPTFGRISITSNEIILKPFLIGRPGVVNISDITRGKFIWGRLWLYSADRKPILQVRSGKINPIVTELKNSGVPLDAKGQLSMRIWYSFGRIVMIVIIVGLLGLGITYLINH